MESNNLGHQELVDHPGSLLESSVQMGSFGGVPDSQVWSQDFLMDGSGNDQNNFAPHLNEVHMNEQQLLNQECDQNHLKKMEAEMSGHGHGPWEMRNPNFQPDDSLNLSSSIGGKQHVSPLPSFNLQLLDDRMHHSCTISDMGSWSMSPSSYSHSGLDMPILPQFQLSSVKDEFMSMPSYSTANSPSTFLQGYGPSDSYKANEPGLPSMIDSKTIFKSHHLGPMHHDYNNIHAAHAFLPSIPSKLSSSLLTFGSNNYLNMNMPVMEFLNSKPSEMRLHRPHSHAYLEGTKKLQNSHQSRAMSLHGGSDSSPEQKRSSGANHESTSDTVFKRPRLEPNSTLSTFKVRKEKLGDRITALQQLVSPFGKTDTASVLLEAIGYIKFLQEQVRALSMPYMKTGCSSTAQGDQKGWGSSEQKESSEARQDLRSRGLCLVPISCTLHVANDNGADYWSPSLGSTYR